MWKKIAVLMVLVITLSLLLTPSEVEARGGGGGGGRGGGSRGGGGARGGGVYRGGHTMNRTPTMSRASNRPAAPQTRQQLQNRPSVTQGGLQQSRPELQQRPSAANRAELRNQVNRYAQSRSAPNIDRQALSQKAQHFASQRNNQMMQNRQLSERVSQRLQQSQPLSNHWFDRNFFDRHNIEGDYLRAGANWWRPAAWATLAGWGTWDWSTPYYYDEGYSYPIVATDSTYDYPDSVVTTPYQPAQSDGSNQTAEGDWLPLGVFAVASDANTAAQTNHFIQLALNRNGEIGGVLYNSLTDDAHELTGMVDPNSQKAYWAMADKPNAPISSTGIYNLTEDQTPINVHFSDGSDQPWTLVRIQQQQ